MHNAFSFKNFSDLVGNCILTVAHGYRDAQTIRHECKLRSVWCQIGTKHLGNSDRWCAERRARGLWMIEEAGRGAGDPACRPIKLLSPQLVRSSGLYSQLLRATRRGLSREANPPISASLPRHIFSKLPLPIDYRYAPRAIAFERDCRGKGRRTSDRLRGSIAGTKVRPFLLGVLWPD